MEEQKHRHSCLSCGVKVPKGVLFCKQCSDFVEPTLDEEASLEMQLLLNPTGRVMPKFDSDYN